MSTRILALAAAALALVAAAALADGETNRGNYLLGSSVVSAGGSPGGNGNFISVGTVGETAVGIGSNASRFLSSGFWRKLSVSTGVIENVIPEIFRNALFGNAPNPFNPVTTIRYETAGTAPVAISIYSVQGRLVRTLVDETMGPGRHETIWDGRDDYGTSVASGVYLYRVQIGEFHSIKKMLLLK